MASVSDLDGLIGRIYDGVLGPAGWEDILQDVARLAGGDSALLHIRSTGCEPVLLRSREFDPLHDIARYWSYYEARSPLIPFFAGRPTGSVHALADYAFSDGYRETEFYRDWVRPQGFGDMIGSHLLRSGSLKAWFSVRRAATRGVYAPHELRFAARFAPHLARAIGLGVALERERTVARRCRDALDAFEVGTVIVDAAGRILASNDAADAILRGRSGLRASHGRLVCDRPGDSDALGAAIAAVAGSSAGASPASLDIAVTHGMAARPLSLHVVPVSACDGVGFAPSAAAAVFVLDPHSRTIDLDAVARAYDLTPAEAKLVCEVVRGGPLDEVAARLGIAVTTARTHLQHVFTKTGTGRQADLVHLAMASSMPGSRRPIGSGAPRRDDVGGHGRR